MFFVDDRDALATYRQLRIAIPLLTSMLAAAIAYQIFSTDPDCWLGSISAYYYTSARAVFVACLCAIGVSLIVYSGNTPREDLALNASGFLAFVVTFVPTPLAQLEITPGDLVGTTSEPVCKRTNVPTEVQLNAAIDNNMLALLVAGTAALAVAFWFRSMRPQSQRAIGQTSIFAVLLVVGWILFAFNRDWVRDHAHLWSAIAMFAGIILVVFMNAFNVHVVDPQAVSPPRSYQAAYRIILALMVLFGIGLGSLALFGSSDHAVFWLEASLILFFAAYWVVQTKELWPSTHRER